MTQYQTKLDGCLDRLRGLHTQSLTDEACRSLTALLGSLNRLCYVSEGDAYASPDECDHLLEQLCRRFLAAGEDADGEAAAAALVSALDASSARTAPTAADMRYEVQDRCFDYLDSGILRRPASDTTAALIVRLLTDCSLSDGSDAPYLDALRTYADDVMPRLETALTPSADGGIPLLLWQMDTVSLLFEAAFLFHDAYRLRLLPVYDVLRRSALRALRAARSLAPTPAPFHPLLLASLSRLLHSDIDAGPSASCHFLAAAALRGLDGQPSSPEDAPSDAYWHYLAVYATATLDYLSARQNQMYDNPFE